MWKNIFDKPEGFFLTKNSSNQIAEKTIDFEDSPSIVAVKMVERPESCGKSSAIFMALELLNPQNLLSFQ